MDMKTEARLGKLGCGAIVLLILIVIAFWTGIAGQLNRQTYDFDVSSAEHQCDGGPKGDCYYVVFGTKGEVFENRDSLINWKFDSASIQAQFRPGYPYRVRTTGFRVAFLSWKPNIISAESRLVKLKTIQP